MTRTRFYIGFNFGGLDFGFSSWSFGPVVLDLDGDGEISSGREIAFSLYTEDDPDDTDMEALATHFDVNHDGRLDANDKQLDVNGEQVKLFEQFRLWQDSNGGNLMLTGVTPDLRARNVEPANDNAGRKSA